MHRRTVRMLLRTGTCPERAAPSRRPSRIDRHLEYLSRRWAEGCHNSAQLHREIRSKGYRGSESSIRHFVARWRAHLPDSLKRARIGPNSPAPENGAKKIVASARRATWLLPESNTPVFSFRRLQSVLNGHKQTQTARRAQYFNVIVS